MDLEQDMIMTFTCLQQN